MTDAPLLLTLGILKMRRNSTPLARFARRFMIAVWSLLASLLLVAASWELVDFPRAGGVDACDTTCMECEAEKTGHHCPPGCPECHAHQGHVASLPSTQPHSLEPVPVHPADVALVPLEAGTPLQQFLSSIYRPPRVAARFS